jgi:hypothetical protein
MATTTRNRAIRLGCYGAGTYIAIVALVYAVTALMTRPDDLGYDAIPLRMLAMPWLGIGHAPEFFPGLILNAVLPFGVGTMLGLVRSRRATPSGPPK